MLYLPSGRPYTLLGSAQEMSLYALWCELNWAPEPTRRDILELFEWWCPPCSLTFPEQDDARPQRCPICDGEATPCENRWLDFLPGEHDREA